jgi:fibronectin type 3 domain-containing protein
VIISKSIRRTCILGFEIVVCIIIGVIASNAMAAQATLAWDPNTESDLAGYRVHYGTASGSYTVHTDVHNVTTYTVAGLTAGQTYYFAATAYDASGNESGYSNPVSYAVPAANGAPTTPATPTAGASNAPVNTAITFSTSATDPNGDSLQYRYDWGGGVLSGWEAASQSHSWAAAGQYAVKAQARDSLGLESAWSSAKTVTISQSPQNQAPAANAGSDQTVNAAAAVSLSGTGTDPENGTLTYQWRQTGGTSVTLSNPTSARASFTAPGIATGAATLTFELRVTDAAGLSAVDTLAVVVQSPDIDGDKVPNSQDAFPTNPAEWKDSNGNGIGDNAEAAAAAKQAPDAPLLVSPINNAVVSTMAILKTGAFRTAVTGTTHTKSRWQVFRDEDDACVLDIQSTTALTSLAVPKLVLDEGTPYFWRVQFIDSKGAVSAWSDYEDFVTNKTNADLNVNGIPDAQEVASTVDLDRDGVMDNKQPLFIKSVKMEGANVQIGVSIKGCSTCIRVESVESEDARQPDSYAYGKPKRMPFGLINFKIAVAKAGDQSTVRLHFSQAAAYFSKWYKYDPITDQWYDFSAYAKFASDRRSVTLTLTDGGPGDADGVANGVIVDPAGIVEAEEEVPAVVPPPSSTSIAGSGGGGSGGGGCFVETAIGTCMTEIPLSFSSLLGLVILMSLMLRARPRAFRQGMRRE